MHWELFGAAALALAGHWTSFLPSVRGAGRWRPSRGWQCERRRRLALPPASLDRPLASPGPHMFCLPLVIRARCPCLLFFQGGDGAARIRSGWRSPNRFCFAGHSPARATTMARARGCLGTWLFWCSVQMKQHAFRSTPAASPGSGTPPAYSQYQHDRPVGGLQGLPQLHVLGAALADSAEAAAQGCSERRVALPKAVSGVVPWRLRGGPGDCEVCVCVFCGEGMSQSSAHVHVC